MNDLNYTRQNKKHPNYEVKERIASIFSSTDELFQSNNRDESTKYPVFYRQIREFSDFQRD